MSFTIIAGQDLKKAEPRALPRPQNPLENFSHFLRIHNSPYVYRTIRLI